MQLSAALCRTQAAVQNERAGATALENVREIAMEAAKAWSIEALAAEERDERARRRSFLCVAMPCPIDAGPNENPDRGFSGRLR